MDIVDLQGTDDKPFMIIKRKDDELVVCEDEQIVNLEKYFSFTCVLVKGDDTKEDLQIKAKKSLCLAKDGASNSY